MADPETKKKIERYRQFRKDYGNHLFAVLMIVFVYAMLTDHDIMDYLHLLRERPVSGIGLAVLLLLVAAGLYVLRKLLRELRSAFEKIAKAVKNTVPAIAEAMEALRRNMLIFRYQILHTKANRRSIKNTLADVVPILRQYSDLVGQIKTLSRERKGLLDEKKATSALNVLKQRELAKRIAQLSEDIEELHSEKAMILSRFDKTDDEGMKEVKKWVASMESSLQRLEQTEAKYQAELDAALAQFRELTGEAESMDKAELHVQRQGLRKTYTQDARDRLQKAHGKQYSPITMMEAQQDVDHLLREDERKLEPPAQKRPVRHQPEPQKKPPKRDYER